MQTVFDIVVKYLENAPFTWNRDACKQKSLVMIILRIFANQITMQVVQSSIPIYFGDNLFKHECSKDP